MAAVRRFKTLEDTRKALAAYLRAIEAGTLDKDTGRTLIYGCNVMASIIRDGDIEKRLEALEAAKEAEP